MKKEELNKLTQIIELLVRKEVQKEIRTKLPAMISEEIRNITENLQAFSNNSSQINESIKDINDEENFKLSMRELFAGASPNEINTTEIPRRSSNAPKHYTKDPVINQILNETTSDLKQRERMVGGAAQLGGYSPFVALAASSIPQISVSGPGEMMDENEIPSLSKMPAMPMAESNINENIKISSLPTLIEGQESSHAPLEALPDGMSALDVARQIPLADPVARALTRNYSAVMKKIDEKRNFVK